MQNYYQISNPTQIPSFKGSLQYGPLCIAYNQNCVGVTEDAAYTTMVPLTLDSVRSVAIMGIHDAGYRVILRTEWIDY